MSESIVGLRLTRNLKYKLTYVRIFETFLESAPVPELTELLQALIQIQQTAIASLASYLRRLEVSTQDLELTDKLIDQAAERKDLKSQLRFIYDGQDRAVAWYRTQLADRQMTNDPELRKLLIELGEMEAAKLWRTEAVMGFLRVPVKLKEKEREPDLPPEPTQTEAWRPRLMDDVGRPNWAGSSALRKPTSDRRRRKGKP
jgi:hypothetical protein